MAISHTVGVNTILKDQTRTVCFTNSYFLSTAKVHEPNAMHHHLARFVTIFARRYLSYIILQNTLLLVGTLRYGQVVSNDLGDTVEWRHW